MAALRAMRRVLRTEADPLTGYGPSSRLLRAATQAIHSSAQVETRAAMTPSWHAGRLTPTPFRATVALHDDQPRHRNNNISVLVGSAIPTCGTDIGDHVAENAYDLTGMI